jgi:hypothetical protein
MEYKDFIKKAGEFIYDDCKSKGEEVISKITFMMGIASLKVKTKEGKRKTVNYSCGELNGYRKINL